MILAPRPALILATALASAGLISSADASRPVPRTLTGCVKDGALTSSGGYTITVLGKDHQRLDLTPYNGMKIRVSGSLLPGDRFYPKTRFERIGTCR